MGTLKYSYKGLNQNSFRNPVKKKPASAFQPLNVSKG